MIVDKDVLTLPGRDATASNHAEQGVPLLNNLKPARGLWRLGVYLACWALVTLVVLFIVLFVYPVLWIIVTAPDLATAEAMAVKHGGDTATWLLCLWAGFPLRPGSVFFCVAVTGAATLSRQLMRGGMALGSRIARTLRHVLRLGRFARRRCPHSAPYAAGAAGKGDR